MRSRGQNPVMQLGMRQCPPSGSDFLEIFINHPNHRLMLAVSEVNKVSINLQILLGAKYTENTQTLPDLF